MLVFIWFYRDNSFHNFEHACHVTLSGKFGTLNYYCLMDVMLHFANGCLIPRFLSAQDDGPYGRPEGDSSKERARVSAPEAAGC
jgi:hypothetical protein